MAAVVWNDDFAVGHATIDDQHFAVLGVLGELQAALVAGEPAASVRLIVDRAVACFKAHCAYEEDLCLRTNYPFTAEHKFEHSRLMLHLNALIKDALTSKLTAEVFNEHLDLLRIWLGAHLANDDRKLAEHAAKFAAH